MRASPVDRDLTPQEVDRSLIASVLDGCAHAVMLGIGEAFLAPFAIWLGANARELGLLASLPLVLGALAQIASIRLLETRTRRKPVVVMPAFLQALSWLLILLLPQAIDGHGGWVVLLATIPYFALGSLGAPPWSSWIGDLVPPGRRGAWFGRRERLRTRCQLLALIAGGLILGLFQAHDAAAIGFAILFLTAALARIASAVWLARMAEPPYHAPLPTERLSFGRFIGRLPKDPFGRLAIFVAFMHVAIQISGPFFSLYMLRDLGLSYPQFIALSATMILLQSLTFHHWGKIADRFGNISVIKLTGALLPAVPLLWLFSHRYEALFIFQAVSGVVWAGFQLAAANFLYDSVVPPERPRSVAYYGLLVNSGMLGGALLGGLLAPHLPRSISVGALEIDLVSNLQVLFLLSAGARLAVVVAFDRIVREVREVERGHPWGALVRVSGIGAIRGLRFSPWSGLPSRAKRKPLKDDEEAVAVSQPEAPAPPRGIVPSPPTAQAVRDGKAD